MAVGSLALAAEPLVRPQPAFLCSHLHVKTCLDTPLIPVSDVKEILVLAACVDASLERVDRVKGAEFTRHQQLQRLIKLCRQLHPALSTQDALSQLGMLEFFPFLQSHLLGMQRYGTPTQHAGAAYLTYVGLLNQVMMMGTQLYNDAVMPEHHKYTAHQVALLYQSLNMLQGDTKPIRRLIEMRFDDIKCITEGPKPRLPVDVASWLQEVTWLCREELQCCPAYIHKRMHPLVQTLQTIRCR